MLCWDEIEDGHIFEGFLLREAENDVVSFVGYKLSEKHISYAEVFHKNGTIDRSRKLKYINCSSWSHEWEYVDHGEASLENQLFYSTMTPA